MKVEFIVLGSHYKLPWCTQRPHVIDTFILNNLPADDMVVTQSEVS